MKLRLGELTFDPDARQLLSGEKELVQIARECGFAHQSHFTSRFKQATGFTPTRWRKMALARKDVSDN